MSFAGASDEFRRYADFRTMPGGCEIGPVFHVTL
jgi:hypothetical protein